MKTPFTPKSLPLEEIPWSKFVNLIAEANATLARYDGRLESIPNPDVLLSPLTTQEAVLSSKIEGTQATLEEVLEFEVDPGRTIERLEDIEEVINYRKALRFAEQNLKERPICLNMIKDIHQILLDGVRGKDKGRGEFRKIQNWIGSPNTPIENATYIPPAPIHLLESLSNWEKYCHYSEKDRLVQIAIVHAQFELIHPFVDGNGRIGRIIIPLFLFDKKVLNSPMFYISSYFEATRDEYFARLLAISQNDDWDGWILYFLKAIIEQAGKNSQKTQGIMSLYDEMKDTIIDITHSRFAIQTLDFLFHRPLFNSSTFINFSSIPRASASRIVKCLEKGKIIRPIRQAKGSKPALYIFPRLLDIVESRT